ncbi:MAG: Cys-rich protein [Leptospira sp.]|nr:Cys-rich protein [Leptospira sp.]
MKNLLNLILVFSFLSASGIFSIVSAADSLCDEPCEKYLSCTEEIHKRKLKPDENKKLKAGCHNTCKKKQQAVIGCYTDNKDSCTAFGACIQKYHKGK